MTEQYEAVDNLGLVVNYCSGHDGAHMAEMQLKSNNVLFLPLSAFICVVSVESHALTFALNCLAGACASVG